MRARGTRNHPNGAALRVITRDGEPWFVAADVCRALDMGNVTMALRRLDPDDVALISIEGISRGNDQTNAVNESGLYSLILGSRKPEAKRFKKWVTMNGLCSTLAARLMAPGVCIQRTPPADSSRYAPSTSPTVRMRARGVLPLPTPTPDMTCMLDDDEKGTQIVRTPGGAP